MKTWTGILLSCALLSGCNTERLAKLEKENAELREKLKNQDIVQNYDFQSRCAKDAEAWFNRNWVNKTDRNTNALLYINHYNKKLNVCYARVYYRYVESSDHSTWSNTSIWNVYENSRAADFSENFDSKAYEDIADHTKVFDCNVQGEQCETQDEFDRRSAHLLSE